MLSKKTLYSALVLAMTTSFVTAGGCPPPTSTPTTEPTTSVASPASSVASPASSVASPASSVASPASSVASPASSVPASPASSAPVATNSSTPSNQTGTTSDIKERATFNGIVYDMDGTSIDGAKVNAKSIDSGVTWVGQESVTVNGAYVFQNAPVGTRIQIDVTKDGFTQRSQTVVLKSNLTGDPEANKYDFTAANKYAIQDEPEITSLKVNGKTATTDGGCEDGVNDTTIPSVTQVLNQNTATSFNGIDSSKFVVEMTFSEPVDQESVKTNFRVFSETQARGALTAPFTIDAGSGYGDITWSSDNKTATFTANKPLLGLTTGTELRYQIRFSNAFKDLSGKQSRHANGQDIRYSASDKSNHLTFSLGNDDTAFTLSSIYVKDNNNGTEDRVTLSFNKPLDVLVKRSIDPTVTQFTGAADGLNWKVSYTTVAPAPDAGTYHFATLKRYAGPNSVSAGLGTLGQQIAFGATGNFNYEISNDGKSMLLKSLNGTTPFLLNDRIYAAVVSVDKGFKSPAGKEISTDNSTDSSVGGAISVATNNSSKVGAAQ